MKVLDKIMKREKVKQIQLSDEERRITAYHEAGHALVAKLTETQNNVIEVSIISEDDMGGYTKIESEFKYYETKKSIKEAILFLIAGRAAEKIVFYDISTSCRTDLKIATFIARKMITVYGMDDEIGPVFYNHYDEDYDYEEIDLMGPELMNKIDSRILEIMKKSEEKATDLLRENYKLLEKIAEELLQKNILYGEDLDKIIEETK